MFKDVSLDFVQSGRTCLANLGVGSCPVRKLICPVFCKVDLLQCVVVVNPLDEKLVNTTSVQWTIYFLNASL